MKPIKKRWHMWKHYTSKWEKTQHGFLAILAIALTVWGFSDGWILGVIALAFWANVTYTFTMKDVWGNAYQQTEPLRSLGAHVGEALHTYTFVKMANVRGAYSIEPDLPAIDPDVVDDDIYTDEIVIQIGRAHV